MADLCPPAAECTHVKGAQPNTMMEAGLCLLKQKKLCDVIFRFEDSQARTEAHQLFLRARSPVFDSMFRGRGSVGEMTVVIEINGTSPERFQEFLEFIYADKFEADFSGALDLIHLAHQYQVEPLITKCKAILQAGLHIDNALTMFQTARKLAIFEDLQQNASDIMEKSLCFLGRNEKFLKAMEAETLVHLLSREDLPLMEVDLFKLALRWGKIRVEARTNTDNEILQKVLAPALSLLRYTAMSPTEFTSVVVPTQLLSPDESVDIFCYYCGDSRTREKVQARRKLNTLPRRRRDGVVTYFCEEKLGKPYVDQHGILPLTESLSFYVAELGPTADYPFKEKRSTMAITGIILQWPARSSSLIISSPQGGSRCSFSVTVMRFKDEKISDETLECKFHTPIHGNCRPGEISEIALEPPMELLDNKDYCISVKDEITHDCEGNAQAQHEYSWQTKRQILTESVSVVLENVTIRLKGTGSKEDTAELLAWGVYPEEISFDGLIRGIRVASI